MKVAKLGNWVATSINVKITGKVMAILSKEWRKVPKKESPFCAGLSLSS
jgi:hypothetical protein